MLESSTDMNALLKDAKRQLNKEECAADMEGKYYAGAKDAKIKLRKEECVLGTEERHYAELRDVQIKFIREECARNMGQQSTSDAAVREVQIKL